MLDESGLTKFPDLAKVLDLFNSQTSTVNTLWNIFIVVNLGIIGFLFKDTEMGQNWKIKIGFTLGFIAYSHANRAAILRSQNILYAIDEYFHSLRLNEAAKADAILLAHEAIAPARIRKAHLIFTIMVALMIWSPNIAESLRKVFH